MDEMMRQIALLVSVIALSGCDIDEPSSTKAVDPPDAEVMFSEGESGATSVDVVRVRLVPFKTPNGARTQKVLVDWKNTGTTTIRAVDADIVPYDKKGNRLESGTSDYTIYAVSDSSPGVAPGDIYKQTKDEGFVLIPGPAMAARVEIKVTEAVESGAF